MLDRRGEHGGQAGAGERVGVAAFGEQAGVGGRREHEPVRQPVGELDLGEVVAQLVLGDVPDERDVRVRLSARGAVRVSSCKGRPSQAERSVGDSVEISRPADRRTLTNSGSITSSRSIGVPGSWEVGSRTAHTSPSPLSDASDNGEYLTHSIICSGVGFPCSGRCWCSFHFG